MSAFTNVSTYCFTPLSDLKDLRTRLIAQCQADSLKGTILLSTEGINLFIAGPHEAVVRLLETLRALPGLEKLGQKFSLSDHQPFNRLLVRIKKEIIAFGVEGINPAERTSPKLPAVTLRQWLDEGRTVTLLDTRNDYEVRLGTFKGAQPIGINFFREFPRALRNLAPELKQQPVVIFCTGGIRCEKAGPLMEREGFREVYQLEGGILRYFEECGGAHYDGECFVFDQRVGVDPALRETDSAVCFACLAPLDPAEQEDPRYVVGVSCPRCFKPEPALRAERLAAHQAALQKLTHPLPGSIAAVNHRPILVSSTHDGLTLLDLVTVLFPHIERAEWERRIAGGRFLSEEGATLSAGEILRSGRRILQVFPAEIEPPVNPDIRLLHEDEAIILVHKPAPLPVHPSGRFNRNTLTSILAEIYAPGVPRPVHRLDANTTGLILFARTRHFCKMLQKQFVAGTVEKRYVVRVQGQPLDDVFTTDAPISNVPGMTGTHVVDEEEGREARTDFKVLRRLADGTSLLEARLHTGRTNQIRVHLWQLGLPVAGDPAYLPGRRLGETQTLDPEASPLQLHAWKLAFDHPISGEHLSFETELPEWAKGLQDA